MKRETQGILLQGRGRTEMTNGKRISALERLKALINTDATGISGTFTLYSPERVSAPMRFCNFSANTECKKMAGKGVQPLNNYTRRFRPSSLKCTDKSGLDGLQAGK